MLAQQVAESLPTLIGSPSQIKWAERIRLEAMRGRDLPEGLLKNPYARTWIDRRHEWGIR